VSEAGGDPRDPKELSAAENADLCRGCTACCTYITIEVDAPRAAWEYDQWIWALHHQGIEMYLERPEKWFLHVATVCRQLDPRGRCSIHGRHPVLCREYDPRSCERRYALSDQRAWFHDAYELEGWLARERPAHWKRLMAWRKDRVEGPVATANGTNGGLIPAQSLVLALSSRPTSSSTRRRA